MKRFVIMCAILIGLHFSSFTQTILSSFNGYADIKQVSGVGPSFTLEILSFTGSPRFQVDGPWQATDVQLGDVIWVDCSRLVIDSIITTSFSSMVVRATVPSGDWSLGVSKPLINTRIAVVRESLGGIPSIPPPPDVNAGVLSGIDGNLFSCILNHYMQVAGKPQIAYTVGLTAPANSVATVLGYKLAKTDMGSGDLYEWNGSTWVKNERSGGGGITTGDKGDIDIVNTLNDWRVDTGAITTVKIADNAVDSTKIKDNAIGSGEIRDGSILFKDIGNNGALNGQVPKWNGVTWEAGSDDNTTYVEGTGIDVTGNTISNTGVITINGESGTVSGYVKNTDPLSGDVTGTLTTTTISKIQSYPVDLTTPPAVNQTLKWIGSKWIAGTDVIGIDSTFYPLLGSGISLNFSSKRPWNKVWRQGNVILGRNVLTNTSSFDTSSVLVIYPRGSVDGSPQSSIKFIPTDNNAILDAGLTPIEIKADKLIINSQSGTYQQFVAAGADTWSWRYISSPAQIQLYNDTDNANVFNISTSAAANSLTLNNNSNFFVGPGTDLAKINAYNSASATAALLSIQNSGGSSRFFRSVNSPEGVVSGTTGDLTLTPVGLFGKLSGTNTTTLWGEYLNIKKSYSATSGQVLKWNGSTWVPSSDDSAPTGTAGGDLNGTYPNPTVDGLQGRPVASTLPTSGQVLKWNGTTWEPNADLGTTYTGGAGIDVTGTVITNTGVTTINGEAGDVVDYVKTTDPIEGDVQGNLTNTVLSAIQTYPVDMLSGPDPNQVIKWNGTAWVPAVDSVGSYNIQEIIDSILTIGGQVRIDTFHTSKNWIKPDWANFHYIIAIGAGGGGASGATAASGVVASGGSGGGAGGRTERFCLSSFLTDTVSVTIGAGGAGGLSVNTNSTASSPGSGSIFAGRTSFGSFVIAPGGAGASSSSGGAGSVGLNGTGGTGGTRSAGGGSGPNGLSSTNSFASSGGAAGGGINVANTQTNGGNSTLSFWYTLTNPVATGGLAGGSNGVQGIGVYDVYVATGASGGGSSISSNGGNGGNGFVFGAGGGGGGGARNGFSSGAGGKGGDGFVAVYSFSSGVTANTTINVDSSTNYITNVDTVINNYYNIDSVAAYVSGRNIQIHGDTINSVDTLYVLISGQSNSMGWTNPYEGDTTKSELVQAWNGTAWVQAKIGTLPFRCAANYPALTSVWGSNNFGFHFCKNLAAYRKAVVRMILVSFDGNPISNWIPNSDVNYVAIQNAITAAGVSKIDYFLWHQGETDENQTYAYYKGQWELLKAQLRSESWFPATTPIVVGGLLRQSAGGIQYEQDENLQTFDYDADNLVGYASSKGLTSNGLDPYHFSGSSLVELGKRYFNVAMSLPRQTYEKGLSQNINPGYSNSVWVSPNAIAANGRVGDPNKPVRTIQAALDSLYNLNGLNDSTNMIVLMPGRYVDNSGGQLTGRIDSRGKYCNIHWMPGAVVTFNQYFTRYDRPTKVRLTGEVNYVNNENTGIAAGNTGFSLYIKGVKGTTGIGGNEWTFEGPYVFRQLDTFIVKRTQSYDNNLQVKQNWTDNFGYVSISGGGPGSSAAALYSDSYVDPIFDKSFFSQIENFVPTDKYAMVSRTGFGGGYTSKRCSYSFIVNRGSGIWTTPADTYHRGIFELGYNGTYDTCRFNYKLGAIETSRGIYSSQSGTHNSSTIYLDANTARSYFACIYLSNTVFNNSTIVIRGTFESFSEPAVIIQNCTFNNTNIVLEGSFSTRASNMDAIRISNCSGNPVVIKNSKANATGTGKSINSTTANQSVEIVNSQLNTAVGANVIPIGSYTLSGTPQTDAFFAGKKALNLPGGTTAERASTPTEGDLRKNVTLHTPEYWNGSAWTSMTPTIFTQINDVTLTNSASETTLIGTVVGSKTLPADFFSAGRSIRIKMYGVVTTPGSPGNLTIRVKLGSTTLATKATSDLVGGALTDYFQLESVVTCRSTGGSGVFSASGLMTYQGSSGMVSDALDNSGSTSTASTTTSQTIDVTGQWDTANASKTIKITQVIVEILN